METVFLYLCFWLLIFMTDLYFNKCYLLACYNRSGKKVNKAINHHLPYSAFWACQMGWRGGGQGSREHLFPHLGAPPATLPAVPAPSGSFVKRRILSPACVCPGGLRLSFLDSAVPLLGTARVPAGLPGGGCVPKGRAADLMDLPVAFDTSHPGS